MLNCNLGKKIRKKIAILTEAKRSEANTLSHACREIIHVADE